MACKYIVTLVFWRKTCLLTLVIVGSLTPNFDISDIYIYKNERKKWVQFFQMLKKRLYNYNKNKI